MSFLPQDSVHGKTSAGCRSHKQDLGEEGHFLRTYSPGRLGQEPASTASVEYLQEVARVRLCLDLAADFLSELQEGSGKSLSQRPSNSEVWGLWETCSLDIAVLFPFHGIVKNRRGPLAGFVFWRRRCRLTVSPLSHRTGWR